MEKILSKQKHFSYNMEQLQNYEDYTRMISRQNSINPNYRVGYGLFSPKLLLTRHFLQYGEIVVKNLLISYKVSLRNMPLTKVLLC